MNVDQNFKEGDTVVLIAHGKNLAYTSKRLKYNKEYVVDRISYSDNPILTHVYFKECFCYNQHGRMCGGHFIKNEFGATQFKKVNK